MFFILNYKTHTFTTADYPEQVGTTIDTMIINNEAMADEIEIINASDENCRMSVDEFKTNWL